VTSASEERLPPSISGLIDLAFAAYWKGAPLYLGLALIVFVLCAIVEFAWPAGVGSPEVKALVLGYTEMFSSAFVVAAIALGIATRLAGERLPLRRLLGASVDRWLAVVGVSIIVEFLFELTEPLSGLGELPDPPAILLLTAPLVWLFWGALTMAGPLAALSGERPLQAMVSGIVRALAAASQPENFIRLCVVAFATIVPLLLQQLVFDTFAHRGGEHAMFWAGFPIDALALGPTSALQTIFALDLARRIRKN
jgi:hypothetical protein